MSIHPLYGPALRGFLHRPSLPACLLALIAAAAAGCSTGTPREESPIPLSRADQPRTDQPNSAQRPARSDAPPSQRPPAMIDNAAVTWAEMHPLLAEAAGGVILEEIALDRALAEELRRRRLTVTDDDARREHELLLRSLSRAAGSTPDAATDALVAVRRARGLGENRFAALLRRNAALRRLVGSEITLTEEELRQGFAVQFGPMYATRLIMTPSERAAAEAMSRLRTRTGPDGSPRAEPFGEVAAALSTDPSGQRGGLIEPISPADPAYPVALRQALPRLKVGDVSDPIALEGGFAIIKLEEVIPGSDRTFEEARPEVEAELRLVRERVAMDALATRLLAANPPIIFDRPLDWSWQVRRDQSRR